MISLACCSALAASWARAALRCLAWASAAAWRSSAAASCSASRTESRLTARSRLFVGSVEPTALEPVRTLAWADSAWRLPAGSVPASWLTVTAPAAAITRAAAPMRLGAEGTPRKRLLRPAACEWCEATTASTDLVWARLDGLTALRLPGVLAWRLVKPAVSAESIREASGFPARWCATDQVLTSVVRQPTNHNGTVTVPGNGVTSMCGPGHPGRRRLGWYRLLRPIFERARSPSPFRMV